MELLEPIAVENEKYDEDEYKNMLDECYPEVTIAGVTFSPSQILEECDPTAFRCGFNDYQEYETVYQCPICSKEFDDSDEAKFCCQTEEEEDLLGDDDEFDKIYNQK